MEEKNIKITINVESKSNSRRTRLAQLLYLPTMC